jgi:uncharacterized protein (UPF0210 family)
MKKVIRSICYFTKKPNNEVVEKLVEIENLLKNKGFEIQTKRICSPTKNFTGLKNAINDNSILLGIGTLNISETKEKFDDFLEAGDVSFNLDLTNEKINEEHAGLLFKMFKDNPGASFCFSYTFNNAYSSPYFPSGEFQKEGFSIGLQPTDLAEGCNNLEEWLNNMKGVWEELDDLFKDNKEFLGIDSSIAPIFTGTGSLINFAKKINGSFNNSVLSDFYVRITEFIKENNPKPAGLCGLMIPCLEDFELTDEYEKGNFSIERNILLSLNSGLGIDTYPVGIDEDPKKIVEILQLIQALSNKYKKPLSVRLVSDGKARIGEKTDFKNQYLKDVIVRSLK